MKILVSFVLLLAAVPTVRAALNFQNCCPQETSSGDALRLNTLGAQLYDAGDYPAAGKDLREALAIEQAKSVRDPATLSSIFFNLAAVARAEFRLGESEALYNRAIATREAVSGPDSPDLGHSLAGLALVYMSQGRLDQAMEAAERAVRVSTIQPVDVHQVAIVQSTLATLLILKGDPARAEAIEQKVVDELSNASAQNSREYLNAITNLGTARLRLANYRQAELDLRTAEALAVRIGGPGHPATATIWNNLAKVREAEGNWKDAEMLFQKAIVSWRTSLGPGSPDVAYGMSNLASLYQRRKRYPEADRLFRQALEIDRAALGPDSLKVARDWDHIGALAAARRHYRDAESATSQALALAAKNFGWDHPDTARIAVNLAVVHYSQAHYDQAAKLFARALPAEEKALGSRSAELATILRMYASSLKAVHDYVGSERADLRATGINTRNALITEQR